MINIDHLPMRMDQHFQHAFSLKHTVDCGHGLMVAALQLLIHGGVGWLQFEGQLVDGS